MTDSGPDCEYTPENDPEGSPPFATRLEIMISAFWRSRQRGKLIALAVSLVLVILATAYGQIRLNAWNRPFYDALTKKDLAGFLVQLRVFAEIAGVLLVLNVLQTWLNQMSRLTLRRGLVEDLLDEWLKPLRAFRLSYAGEYGANPDQRLAADAQHLSDLTTDLGIGLLQSGLLLVSFIGVLWALSTGMFINIGGFHFAPPGYMVWCALLYAGLASALSWWVGRPLIALDATHYAREADFRFELVRVNEGIEAIAMAGGEAAERQRLEVPFGAVLAMSRRIVGAITRLTWVTAGYGWFTIVAPILVSAPAYFAGKMTFGELMMVVGAFNQVQQSLRWFIDNFSSIADWRATLMRVSGFRRAARHMDAVGRNEQLITRELDQSGGVEIETLCISGPAGAVRLEPRQLVLAKGTRLVVEGGDAASGTLLFRALIGLWLWGRGRVAMPAPGKIDFVPLRTYLPTGSLRGCVTYPAPADAYPPAAVEAALKAVGLQGWLADLDRVDRWERRLSVGEARAVSLARIVLARPDWVVIDMSGGGLGDAEQLKLEALFDGALAGTGLIAIGARGARVGFFGQRARLQLDAGGARFVPAIEAAAAG